MIWDTDDHLYRFATEAAYRRKVEEVCGPNFPQCWSCARLFYAEVRPSGRWPLLCVICARLARSAAAEHRRRKAA